MEPIARGRAADVYALGDGFVLRRYRTPHISLMEGAVMQHVAGHGFPVPAVVSARGGDLVMERVDGPTMLADLGRRPWRVRRHARTLADLHRRLAAIEAPAWLPRRFGEGHAVQHLDLHPDNVILGRGGPVVIDWTNTGRGSPDAALAHTWLLLATSAIPGPRWRRALLGTFRRVFVRMLLDGADRDALWGHMDAVAAHRAADRNLLPAEREAITRFLKRGP